MVRGFYKRIFTLWLTLAFSFLPMGASYSQETTPSSEATTLAFMFQVKEKFDKIKKPSDFAEVFGKGLSPANRKYLREATAGLKEIPKFSLQKNGWTIETKDFQIKTDISRIAESIVFLNNQKFVIDFSAPLEMQVEIIAHRLSQEKRGNDKFSILFELLFSTASAEGRKNGHMNLSFPGPEGSEAPNWRPERAKSTAEHKAGGRVMNTILSIGAFFGFCPNCRDAIVEIFSRQTCDLGGNSTFISDFDACRKYKSQKEEDLKAQPGLVAQQNIIAPPAAAAVFETSIRVCPHNSENNTYEAELKVKEQPTLSQEGETVPLKKVASKVELPKKQKKIQVKAILEKNKDEKKPDNIKEISVFENNEKIAVLEFVNNSLTKIKFKNDKYDPLKPSLEKPTIEIEAAKIIEGKREEDVRLETKRKNALNINEYVTWERNTCAFMESRLTAKASAKPDEGKGKTGTAQ